MSQSLGHIYLICGWLEAIFYGFNCMLFGFCVHVLTSNQATSRRVLIAAVVQFSLSTAHIITTLVELLQAFTHGVDPNVYYLNLGTSATFMVGFYIYAVNTYMQELLLIWRLYSLWGGRFSVCILPLIIWTTHVCIGLIGVSSLIPTTATALQLQYGLVAWGLETATNLSANLGIAYRLWKAKREAAPLGRQRLDYHSIMLWMVECGALITTCTMIMFGLYGSGQLYAIVGVGIAAQIATTSPLLIVVRVGLDQTRSCRQSQTVKTSEVDMYFAGNVAYNYTVSPETGNPGIQSEQRYYRDNRT